MAFVEIRNLKRRYSGNFILGDISLELDRGENLTLMGPSGSGKTSLLRNICGLDVPDSGRIILNGKDITYIPTPARGVGMIFQDLAIFPHMSVYDNIAFGLRSRRLKEDEVEDRVTELSGMLGIKDLLYSYPGNISGGQRQRVALARSVAPSPSVLLLDEPMSSLDMQLRSNLRSEIKSFASKIGITMIYVTHDHNEGLYMADRTGLMFNGTLDGFGPPDEVFMHPKSIKSARFFGYNVVEYEGRKVAFYPSEFIFREGDGIMKGTVKSVGFEGEYNRVHVILDTGEVVQLQVYSMKDKRDIKPGNAVSFIPTRIEELSG